jgi:lactonase
MNTDKKTDDKVSMVPIPPDLINLPTIEAEPWFQIDPGTVTFLEGPVFDREDNLFVTYPQAGKVFRVTPQKQMSVIFDDKKIEVDGAAFHRDGRLFIACLSGELLIISPGDYQATPVYPEYQGNRLSMNDLVFDPKGNIYVTDFTGTVMEPTGGVYRISADLKTVQPVLLRLPSPNGVSLSPEGNVLWIGESSSNTILRIALLEDGVTCSPVSGAIPVYFSTGFPGPDSNKVDSAGNLYQCIMGQGRIVVLNERGIPVANVIIPGREDGKFLRTSNLAFRPGTSEGYITTSGEGGAWIFRFKGLAEGLPLFSHQDMNNQS